MSGSQGGKKILRDIYRRIFFNAEFQVYTINIYQSAKTLFPDYPGTGSLVLFIIERNTRCHRNLNSIKQDQTNRRLPAIASLLTLQKLREEVIPSPVGVAIVNAK